MAYFDDAKNVRQYIKMAEGYDGRELIKVVKRHLPKGSSVLELGMGPGKDLDLFTKHYRATGSDSSQVFLNLYRKRHEDADLLLLDAVTIETDRRFDGLYSNKVQHHLTKKELRRSLEAQERILNPGGVLFHTFWRGSRTEEYHGLLFVYYMESELREIFQARFEVLSVETYKEMAKDDSLYIVSRRRGE